MDNFDLKKYLVENKVTTNSQMLDEAANLKDIMSKLQAGDFASLAKMPGDQKLAQTILKTLKQSQPELLKKLTAYAKKNEKMLAEGAIKNTLLGLLMALTVGAGVGALGTHSVFGKNTPEKGGFDHNPTHAHTQQNHAAFEEFMKNEKAVDIALITADGQLRQDLQNLKAGRWNDIKDAKGVINTMNYVLGKTAKATFEDVGFSL